MLDGKPLSNLRSRMISEESKGLQIVYVTHTTKSTAASLGASFTALQECEMALLFVKTETTVHTTALHMPGTEQHTLDDLSHAKKIDKQTNKCINK